MAPCKEDRCENQMYLFHKYLDGCSGGSVAKAKSEPDSTVNVYQGSVECKVVCPGKMLHRLSFSKSLNHRSRWKKPTIKSILAPVVTLPYKSGKASSAISYLRPAPLGHSCS